MIATANISNVDFSRNRVISGELFAAKLIQVQSRVRAEFFIRAVIAARGGIWSVLSSNQDEASIRFFVSFAITRANQIAAEPFAGCADPTHRSGGRSDD
jgi:hypothetical protein